MFNAIMTKLFVLADTSNSSTFDFIKRVSTEWTNEGTFLGINKYIAVTILVLVIISIAMFLLKVVSMTIRLAAAAFTIMLLIGTAPFVSWPSEIDKGLGIVPDALSGVVDGLPVVGSDSSNEGATFTGSYDFVAFNDTITPDVALTVMESMPSFEYNYDCVNHYEREEWKHWSTASKFTDDVAPGSSSINTRHNELYRESLVPVELSSSNRSVVSGEWQLVYTEGTTTNPQDLDAEHVVPLGNANCIMYSMGLNFDEDTREQLANDINLVFMAEKGENRARGAATWVDSPYGDAWFPSNAASHCGWISLQIQVRDEYGLGITDEERSVATGVLEGCLN